MYNDNRACSKLGGWRHHHRANRNLDDRTGTLSLQDRHGPEHYAGCLDSDASASRWRFETDLEGYMTPNIATYQDTDGFSDPVPGFAFTRHRRWTRQVDARDLDS